MYLTFTQTVQHPTSVFRLKCEQSKLCILNSNSTFKALNVCLKDRLTDASYIKAAIYNQLTRDIAGSVPWRNYWGKIYRWVSFCKNISFELLSLNDERQVGGRTSSGRSFQIIEASYTQLIPKCSILMMQSVGPQAPSSTSTSIVHTESRSKKYFKIFRITTLWGLISPVRQY